MKASEGKTGRVFVIRLEDGDVIPDCLEEFARSKDVSVAQVILLGGVCGGETVVGPRNSESMPPDPMLLPVDGAREVAAVGVLAPGPDGKATLHIHGAMGRSGQTLTGCMRPGVNAWLVCEAIMTEITGAQARRVADPDTGFALLEPE